MGTTGSSENIAMNTALPDLIASVREYSTIPLAVGFGVATPDHFKVVVDAGADGVVIGSRLVTVIKNAPVGQVSKHVETFCREISVKGARVSRTPRATPSPVTHENDRTDGRVAVESGSEQVVLPARFGQFGGQYVPEALFGCLAELEAAHKAAINDPKFWKEFESFFGYMNRPSQLYFAEKLTQNAGGAKIWLKREDLYGFCGISPTHSITDENLSRNHTGSHKINNAIGQVRTSLKVSCIQ